MTVLGGGAGGGFQTEMEVDEPLSFFYTQIRKLVSWRRRWEAMTSGRRRSTRWQSMVSSDKQEVAAWRPIWRRCGKMELRISRIVDARGQLRELRGGAVVVQWRRGWWRWKAETSGSTFGLVARPEVDGGGRNLAAKSARKTGTRVTIHSRMWFGFGFDVGFGSTSDVFSIRRFE